MNFSWFEAVQASISSCLPCLTTSSQASSSDQINSNRPPRHLHVLLTNHNSSSSSLDETLSLHSDVGDPHRRGYLTRKKKNQRSITLFGFNLFGKRPPPIHLPSDDEEEFLRPHRIPRTSNSSSSSYTFDSDAAPLDSAAINRFTAQDIAARVLEQQEAERLAKEERRRKRRERRELKRLAGSMVHATTDGGEGDFEGFQGSGGGGGGGYKPIPPPLLQLAKADANPASDEEDNEADLDGITYARSSSSANGGSHSGARSNSDSRTSSSVSPTTGAVGVTRLKPVSRPKSRSRSAKHSSSSKTHSSASAGSTQSPTLLGSPLANTFDFVSLPPPTGTKVDPGFEGVDFDAVGDVLRIHDAERFPSVGLGTRA